MRKKARYVTLVFLVVSTFVGCSNQPFYTNEKRLADNVNSYNLNNEEQTVDEDAYYGDLEFEGIAEIWRSDDAVGEIKVNATLKTSSGKTKLIYIDANSNVKNIIEVDADNDDGENKIENYVINIKEGEEASIKLVSDEMSKINVELEISDGTFNTIGLWK